MYMYLLKCQFKSFLFRYFFEGGSLTNPPPPSMTKYRAYIHCRYYCFITLLFFSIYPTTICKFRALKTIRNQSDLYSEIHLNSSP